MVRYVINLEDDNEENVSGVKVEWKDTNGEVTDECTITSSLELTDLKRRVSEIVSNTLRPSDVLAALLQVDGIGSGIDADSIQGLTPSVFALKSHNHDERYYTKSEVDTLIRNSSNSGSSSSGGSGSGGSSTINKTTPTVTIGADNSGDVNIGTNVKLTATVPSNVTGSITFYRGSTSVGTATISAGAATLTLSSVKTGDTGTYKAHYNGSTYYNAVDSENTIGLNVVDMKAVNINATTTSLSKGDGFVGTLTDYKGSGIAGHRVHVTISGSAQGSSTTYTKEWDCTTDYSGTFTCEALNLDWGNTTLSVVCTYAGSTNYNGASKSFTVPYSS